MESSAAIAIITRLFLARGEIVSVCSVVFDLLLLLSLLLFYGVINKIKRSSINRMLEYTNLAGTNFFLYLRPFGLLGDLQLGQILEVGWQLLLLAGILGYRICS